MRPSPQITNTPSSLPSFPPTASIHSSTYLNSGKRPLLYQRPATQAPKTPGNPQWQTTNMSSEAAQPSFQQPPLPKSALITISQSTILAEAPDLPEVTLDPRTPKTPEATLALHLETQRPSSSPTPKWRHPTRPKRPHRVPGPQATQTIRLERNRNQGKHNHPTKTNLEIHT